MKKFTSNFKLFLLLAAMVAGVSDADAYVYSKMVLYAGNGGTVALSADKTGAYNAIKSGNENAYGSSATMILESTTWYSGINQGTLYFYAHAQANNGYYFSHWSTSNGGSSTSTDNPWHKGIKSGKVSQSNAVTETYYAVFAPTSYTITYNLDGGTNNANNPATYTIESATITLADPTRGGFIFDGWTTDGVSTPTKSLQIVNGSTGNKAFTAHWTPATLSQTITWNQSIATQQRNNVLTLNATASSGLTVTYTASPADLVSISGNQVTCLKPGHVTITANQNGSDSYLAATSVSKEFDIYATPTFDWNSAFSSTIYVGQTINPVLSSNSDASAPVQYTITNFVPSGSNNDGATAPYIDASGLHCSQAGTFTLKAEQSAGVYYLTRTEEKNITVAKHDPTFTQNVNNSKVGKVITLDEFFTSNNSTTAITISSSDANVNIANNIIYTLGEGDAHIKVSQAENYYWAAKEETYTLSIGAATTACWSGETPTAGQYYILNAQHNNAFLKAENTVTYNVDEATLFTFSAANGTTISYLEGDETKYISQNSGNGAWGNSQTSWSVVAATSSDPVSGWKFTSRSGDSHDRHIAIGAGNDNLSYIRRDWTNYHYVWNYISPAQMSFHKALVKAQNYLATKSVPLHIKNVLVAVIAANDCESTNSYAARTANLNNAIDVYDAYFEVKDKINASSAEQSAKDAALLELDNNRTTRSELEAVLAMLKKSAFVTNNYAGQTIYVGDDLTEVFTFDGCSPFGADFSVLSVVTNSIAAERNPLHTDDVLAYNSTSNSMAIYNAGQATITFRQKETAEYYAKDIAIDFNVVKRDPEYTYCTTNDRVYFNRQYPAFVVSTNTECAFSTLNSSNTAVATVEEVSTGIIKMVVSDQAASTTITFEQPGNYQFNASGVQTFTFTPKEAQDHVPFTLTSGNYQTYKLSNEGKFSWDNGLKVGDGGGGFNWDDKYVILTFSGIPDKLTFDYRCTNVASTWVEWYVSGSSNGTDWTTVWNSESASTSSQHVPDVQLSPSTRYLKLCYSGNFGGYFQNVNVTELKYFEVSETSLDWGARYVGDTEDKSFVFRHANAAGVTTITAPEHFQVSLDGTNFASSVVVATSGIDLYGEQTIYVRYLTDEVNTCTDAVLNVSDGKNEKTILLSGSTAKYPTAVILEPQFEIYVGQDPATVEFATPWTVQETINNTGVAGTFAISTPTEFLDEVMGQTIMVVFTPTQADKYEECSFTATKDVLRREIVFDGDQDEAWTKDGNWNVESAPSEYDDVRISSPVVVSTDVEVHGLTIDAGTSVTVESGATLTIGAGGSRDVAEYGDLIIKAGGQVVLSGADVKVRNFYINTELGDDTHAGASSSSQLDGSTHLEVLGDAFIDIKMDPSGSISYGFYDFVLPFPCDAKTGVSYIDATGAEHPMVLNRDYAFSAFSEATRATGAYAWGRFNGVLETGLAYSITLDDDYKDRNLIRFRKTAVGAINTSNTTALQVSDGNDMDKGWNGIGNATLSYADLRSAGVPTVQVYNHATNSYSPVAINAFTYVVGSSFFVQVGAPQDLNFVRQDNPSALRAPSRNADDSNEQFMIEFAAEQSDYTADRLYLSADEDALSTYEIGKDLLKFGNPTEAKKAQISGLGYGKNLCQMYFPMLNNEAVFPVSLFAPAAGDYVLRAAEVVDGQDLYLLENGVPVWNLSDGEYTLSLNKGSNTDYSLAIRANAPAVPTGADAVASDSDVEKIIINGALFVRKNGMIFDAMGNRVK